jgi:hypothetical protein
MEALCPSPIPRPLIWLFTGILYNKPRNGSSVSLSSMHCHSKLLNLRKGEVVKTPVTASGAEVTAWNLQLVLESRHVICGI